MATYNLRVVLFLLAVVALYQSSRAAESHYKEGDKVRRPSDYTEHAGLGVPATHRPVVFESNLHSQFVTASRLSKQC